MILCSRLKHLIDKLKKSIEKEPEAKNMSEDYCSETDTEANGYLSNSGSDAFCSPKTSYRSKTLSSEEELNEDASLMSPFQSIKSSSKKRTGLSNSTEQSEQSLKSLQNLTSNHQTVVGRKRVRVVLSDDDDEMESSTRRAHDCLLEDFVTSDASEF